MKTKVDKRKKGQVKLTISIEPKEMIKYFNRAYENVAPTVKLSGFRPGKAPRALVESAIGITRLLSEALDMAVNESYQKSLQEEKLVPITQPAIKINKYPNYGQSEDEVKNELEYEAELTVLPEIELSDYSKIKVEKPKEETVKEGDIDKILENLRKQKANFVEVDRPAKMGDLAEVSFEGSVKKVKIDAMRSKNHPVVLGENTLIPGFEEEVVGMKKGEKKTFTIKFPKDYHAKEFAGKEAEFEVELNNLKEVKLPEIDDKFAADFGQKDVKELKKSIAKNLEIEYKQKNQSELEQKVLDKVLPLVKVDLPEIMIDQEVERMMAGYAERLQSMGANLDTYLKGINKNADDIRKEMRPTAEKNIKIGLMLGKIIQQEKIDAKDENAGKKAIDHLLKTIVK